MNRVERFRQLRKSRRKYILVVILFIMLVISGICIVDYSINSLMYDNNQIEVLSFRNSDNCFEISILKNKFYVNTTYMKRDYEKLKGLITGLFQSK